MHTGSMSDQMTSQVADEEIPFYFFFCCFSFFFFKLTFQALQLKISIGSPAFMLTPNPIFLHVLQ